MKEPLKLDPLTGGVSIDKKWFIEAINEALNKFPSSEAAELRLGSLLALAVLLDEVEDTDNDQEEDDDKD